MQEYNFFDLLKISPFPKIPSGEEIRTAIEKWRVDTVKRANSSGTAPDQKRELQEMVQLLPPRLEAFAADSAEQNRQKDQYRDAHCAQLQTAAECMKKYSGASIREATIRRIARSSGLLPDDVKRVFRSSGFEVLPSAPAAGVFPDSKHLKTFSDNMEQLKKALARGVGHIPDEISSVRDLYGYLKLILEYEGLEATSINDWKAVQAKFNELSVRHATGTEPYNFYRNIESMAKTGLFNSDENRRKYDYYLKFQESGLADALEAIAGLPEAVRTDPIFARNWVSSIQQQLSIDEEEAYQVYNQCCRIPPEERLEKEDIQVRTLCSCGYLNVHESLRAAEAAQCPVCGKKLYIPCPSCGKPVRNSADHCPSCSYYLAGEQIFYQAVEACKSALQRRQLQEARKHLERARDHQLQKYSLKELESQLNALESSIGSSLGRIDQLILAGKLNEAARELQALRASNPGIDVSAQMRNLQQKKQMIDSQRKSLDARMQGVLRLPPREQVRTCMEILSQDENYEPALQLLRSPSLAPLPVCQLRVLRNDETCSVSISWDPNPDDIYVTYTVIRMNSQAVPASPQDGTVLARDLETTSYQDTAAVPGTILFYAVFAVRKNVGTWSLATTSGAPIALMPGCSAFTFTIAESDCVLQWAAPKGCAGVKLERCDNRSGQWNVIQQQILQPSYTDRGLRLDASYQYRCTALWNIGGKFYASPISRVTNVQLQKKPSPVDLSLAQQQENGLCSFSWQTGNQGSMEIWAVPLNMRLTSGTLIDQKALSELGSRLWQGAAAARTAAFTVPSGREQQLLAACAYGAQMVVGRPVFISTMRELPVLWDQLKLTDNELALSLPSGEGLTEVRVFLDVESPSREIIVGQQPFFSQKLNPGVREKQIIRVPHLPQRELWVAVAGITQNGSVTRASCHLVNNLPRLPVTYAVNWKKSGVFRSSVTGLEITVRVRERTTPHVLLVTNRRNATIPLRENEYIQDQMNILLDIPAGNSSETRGRVPEAAVKALPIGARVKLMLAPDVQTGYRAPVPENALTLTMPT